VVGCDLVRDVEILHREIRVFKPVAVFHLAAATDAESDDQRSLVTDGFHAIENLLDACQDLAAPPRVVAVSSSAVYGDSRGRLLTERSRTAAVTMYGVSKLVMEAAAMRRSLSSGITVIRARVFNVIGPAQQPNRALAAFARQIAEIEAGIRTPPIQTAGTSAYRDFIDVRDVTSGLCTMAERGIPGEVYNVCSGRAVKVATVLHRLLGMSRAGTIPVVSIGDHGVAYQRGDNRRLAALPWRPRISLNRSLQDVLEDWRARVARG
jgi:GDP-4-dehydro-6-deoxy-D-mannose reductase